MKTGKRRKAELVKELKASIEDFSSAMFLANPAYVMAPRAISCVCQEQHRFTPSMDKAWTRYTLILAEMELHP